MGIPRKPKLVKLIIGFIYNNESRFDLAKKTLEKKFGPIDFESGIMNFNYTGYYSNEFGLNLKRKFISFRKLRPQENTEKIKIFTNRLENKLSTKKKRTVNIDPGYITDAKLVLLTTKDFSHRIYLGKGIYAELTLFFRNGSFEGLGWTYPDYKTDYINIFNTIRKLFLEDIKIPKRGKNC